MLYDVAVAVVSETLSCVWIEAVMFGCAAIAYLAVSGRILAKKPLKVGRHTPLRGFSAKGAVAKTLSTPPRSEAVAARIASSEPKKLSGLDTVKVSVTNDVRERGNARDQRNRMGEQMLNSMVQSYVSCEDWTMVKQQLLEGQRSGVRLTHANTHIDQGSCGSESNQVCRDADQACVEP